MAKAGPKAHFPHLYQSVLLWALRPSYQTPSGFGRSPPRFGKGPQAEHLPIILDLVGVALSVEAIRGLVGVLPILVAAASPRNFS